MQSVNVTGYGHPQFGENVIWNKRVDIAHHVGQEHFIGYIPISQSDARKI